MPSPFSTIPRTVMVICNLFYSMGAFYFDWSETHVLNPRWPPHARFHNGQTMSLGLLLASTSLWLLSRTPTSAMLGGPSSSSQLSARHARDLFTMSALVGSLYTAAGLSAILYPGTDWADPEFNIEGAPQAWAFGVQLIAMWIAYAVEVRGLQGKAKEV